MEQVQTIFANFATLAASLWHLELFKSGDNSIYFNQVFIAVIHLLFGFFISRKLSQIIYARTIKLGKLDEVKAHLLKQVSYFAFLLLFILVALPIAGIPIAAFTILGSALAIGIGFGAQNLFNNLISSFIILMEKPIRIGDIVSLGDTEGKVADIGNRCVRIRRGDGIDMIVPNSHFLEQQVINWTLSDKDLRGELKVGVAYGSPVNKVRELLEQAAQENPQVFPQPPPFVLFEDFGDNALLFTIFYWARISLPLDLRRISSSLRFRIEELFQQHGIVVAFPQRDLHVDVIHPIDVRINEDKQNTE